TKDYYGLASILASSKQLANVEKHVSELYFAPLVPKDVAEKYEAHQARITVKQKEINDLLAEEGARYRDALALHLADYMLAARREVPAEPKFPAGENRFFTEVTSGRGPFALAEKDREKAIDDSTRARLASLDSELKALKASAPPEPPLACALAEGKIVDQRV